MWFPVLIWKSVWWIWELHPHFRRKGVWVLPVFPWIVLPKHDSCYFRQPTSQYFKEHDSQRLLDWECWTNWVPIDQSDSEWLVCSNIGYSIDKSRWSHFHIWNRFRELFEKVVTEAAHCDNQRGGSDSQKQTQQSQKQLAAIRRKQRRSVGWVRSER